MLLFLISTIVARAQNANVATNKVALSGSVKENLKKYNISDATVALYEVGKGILVTSTRTNKDGVFNLLVPAKLATIQLRVTHVGYKEFRKDFTLKSNIKTHNIDAVLLQPDTLKAVDVLAPKKNQINALGSIKGKVKDSVYKNVLSSATVSVYNHTDSSLLQFTLPNNFGEFSIGKLPINASLKLMVTHVGYTPYQKIFKLSSDKNIIDFDWIYMYQNEGKDNMLKEVEITSYAPVRMNGDTIEFNPRAFKMDANATTEDLMRILPGMVIWGDGDITYNGKKINSLLVDGKPFMGGGDFTTATQNLPKDVLDKVQIYSQRDDKNPLDSTLFANLKLKEDKKIGYFGKVGAGYGTNNRIAADGMLSGFNKKFQISNVGAYNNVNKSANDIEALIRSNSFKGEGNNIDYQSDFRKPGVNRGTTVGTKFQYDFIPDVTYKNSKRLIGDYFFKQNNETINSTRITNTLLKADSILNNNVTSQTKNNNSRHHFSTNYAQQSEDYSVSITARASKNNIDTESKGESEQTRTGIIGSLSTNTTENRNRITQNSISIAANFNYSKESFDDDDAKKRKKYLFSNFIINYKFDYEESNGDRNNLSTLLSNINPSANRFYDRLYETSNSNTNHTLGFSYPNLKTMLFGFTHLAGIELDLGGNFIFRESDINSSVFDKNNISNLYDVNSYLTNNRNEHIKDMQPKLVISKSFYKGLTNRFSKNLNIALTSAAQFYSLKSTATNETQNINYQFSNFIPNVNITYKNHQYGDFEINSNLNYYVTVNYPSVNSIAPLVDSTNVWYIPKGNKDLKPESLHILSWKVNFESRTPKNPYSIDLILDGNFSKNKITDSTFYDNLGRRIDYNINLDGYKYWHLGSSYRKSYSPNKKNTFRGNIWYNYYNYTIPQYLDAILTISNNSTNNLDFELTYSFLDIINLNAKQGLSYYKNIQSTDAEIYKGSNNYTRISGTFQFPKNLTWSTNINYNTNKAENQATVNYTIWNASITYRFLQGNRGEVKLSALDLLKENKSIINTTNRNVQTFGFNNVLQQYFLVGLAYYPRKFGK